MHPIDRVSCVNAYLDREFRKGGKLEHLSSSSIYLRPGDLFRQIHREIGKQVFISVREGTVELMPVKWWQRYGIIRRLFYKHTFFFSQQEKQQIDTHFLSLCQRKESKTNAKYKAVSEKWDLPPSLSNTERCQYARMLSLDQEACLAFLKAKAVASFSLSAWAMQYGIPLTTEEVNFCNTLSPLQQFRYCHFFPDERSDYALLSPLSRELFIDNKWTLLNDNFSLSEVANNPRNWWNSLRKTIWEEVICKEVHAIHDTHYARDPTYHIRAQASLRDFVNESNPFDSTILDRWGKDPLQYAAAWRQQFASTAAKKKERNGYWNQMQEPHRSLLPTLSRKEYLCYLHEMSATQQQAFLDFLAAKQAETFDLSTWAMQHNMPLMVEEAEFCNALPPLQQFRYCKLSQADRRDYALLCPASRYRLGNLSTPEEKKRLEEWVENPVHWDDPIFDRLYSEQIRPQLIACHRQRKPSLSDQFFSTCYPLTLTRQESRDRIIESWEAVANKELEDVAQEWRNQYAPPIAKKS